MTLQASLPREHYVDTAAFGREQRLVWQRSWVCVGRVGDLGLEAGDRVAVVDVAGESVVLTRDGAGALHAVVNVCRHRGARVVTENRCAAQVLRCAYHSWTYALDGRLLRAPHTDAADALAGDDAFALHRVDVDAWGGWVWVRLRGPGPSLTDELGPVPARTARYPLDRLVSARSRTYEVAANWKVVAENYNECYHCGPVHPELTRLVPGFGNGGNGIDGTGLEWEAGIAHREGAWTFSFSGTSPRPPFPDLDDAERVRHKGELVYPNLLLSLSAEHAAAYVLEPLAADRTRVRFDVLVAPDQAGTDVEDCFGFWDLVNGQDWAVCESVQQGMRSSFWEHGWYAPMEDASLDIRRWLLPRLADGAGGAW